MQRRRKGRRKEKRKFKMNVGKGGGGECAKEKFEMQIGFNMDDSGLDKIRSNTSCRQPASGELAYSASLRQVHSSALHQAPAVPLTQ